MRNHKARSRRNVPHLVRCSESSPYPGQKTIARPEITQLIGLTIICYWSCTSVDLSIDLEACQAKFDRMIWLRFHRPFSLLRARRLFANARSVAMNRFSIGAMSDLGSVLGPPSLVSS